MGKAIIDEVKEKLINVLEQFCPDNVFLQGTLNAEQDFPQKFITFFITSSQLNAFYDNVESERDFYITVIFYSNNPAEISTYAENIMNALRADGFVLEDAGNDIISTVPTNTPTHTGWAMDFIYIKRII